MIYKNDKVEKLGDYLNMLLNSPEEYLPGKKDMLKGIISLYNDTKENVYDLFDPWNRVADYNGDIAWCDKYPCRLVLKDNYKKEN